MSVFGAITSVQIAGQDQICVSCTTEVTELTCLRSLRAIARGRPSYRRESVTASGLPETAIGIFPSRGCTQCLARIIGEARALEIILWGAVMSAEPGAARRLPDRRRARST